MQGRILDAAARVFAQKGYHKASMEEIAGEADVAKGSLYYHFRNKSELFRDVAVSGMEELQRELREAVESQAPIEEKIAAAIDRISMLCFDYSGLFNIIMSEELEGMEPEAWLQVQQAKGKLLEYISLLLREGCETEHALRPHDYQLVTHALMSFINTYRREYLARGRTDRERMIREIREIVMFGLMVRP